MASDHQHPVLTRLAAAWLRDGPATTACRWVKTCVPDGAPVDLGALAEALHLAPGLRAGRIAAALDQAERAWSLAGRSGVVIRVLGADGYPARLAQIADPPVAIWTRGPVPLDGSTVAIVGSRRPTPSGLRVAAELARDLATAGYTIVSGMAAGIDGAAHQAALRAGGATIAVLGCGIDVVYPREHDGLSRDVAARGCLVSEFAPGTGPRPYHFPMRNRVIAGLARAVVVVEAGVKSGSLITASQALQQGRDVMAVPGPVSTDRYRGCHALLRDGARLVESYRDVIEELEGVSARTPARPDSGTTPLLVSDLERVMARGCSCQLEDLVARTGRAVPDLLAELGQLEIEGRVVKTDGGGFVRP